MKGEFLQKVHKVTNRLQSYTFFLNYTNIFKKKTFFVDFYIFSCMDKKKIVPLSAD